LAKKRKGEVDTSAEFEDRNEHLNRDVRSTRIAGLALLLFSAFTTFACISYLFSGAHDQELFIGSGGLNESYQNWMGGIGARWAHALMFHFAGIAALCIPFLIFLISMRMLTGKHLLPFLKSLRMSVGVMLFLPLAIGFFAHRTNPIPFDHIEILINGLFVGGYGVVATHFCVSNLGWMGTLFGVLFVVLVFFIVNFNHHVDTFIARLGVLFRSKPKADQPRIFEEEEEEETPFQPTVNTQETTVEVKAEAVPSYTPEPEPEPEPEIYEVISDENTPTSTTPASFDFDNPLDPQPTFELIQEEEEEEEKKTTDEFELSPVSSGSSTIFEEDDMGDLGIEIAPTVQAEELSSDEIESTEFGEYDPKLDLSRYQLPSIDLLQNYGGNGPQISKEELEENKNRIIETLNHYKIEIAKIKATIGPTVTLYEIVPAPGVRISKIKSLEDDIALSLAALGIRIIAPIPGKGTIGIEVPNSRPDVVSMRSLIASDKFQNADMELPLVLGKTISNDIFVTDLTKMPHLLMAGATGQGKSVGLNAILVSLLYRKHPSQVKFVLVDPKKVELTLFNKIERHFLAKLPDEAEAIITDTSKAVKTLNSLCVEMDERYGLLKTAECRTIKEYNAKFISRKLNPNNGHRFLPYIVLVVDEFADLIMTAGREVETPIARLAQLARAIGIHLIIATQRPSVNIITGTIKANFPARIAFRVTSKIDSRTILDAGGADQLIGRGDMLLSTGNDLIRLQCGFVDTPEVQAITEFIGSQQGYAHAFHLPEVADENSMEIGNFDNSERDSLFEEAAKVIVLSQQGSASLLQRKLKLGYNRAGRLIDQLEAAGVIGPFEGSKARKVLIPDEIALEQFLKTLRD
jgi:S-DNA-T family DNA segregation ATPase FtsK/SpoIIIE